MSSKSQIETAEIWKTARKYPRISLTIPIDVRAANERWITNSLNVSVGGMLLQPHQKAPTPGTDVRLSFNLPTGYSISTAARVVHLMGSAVGVQFVELDETSRTALSRFLRRMITYVRRGVRVTRRMHVTIRRAASPQSEFEMAETIVISRHGGLLSTRAQFGVDDEIVIWWPDGKRGTNARVVHRRVSGIAGLVEMGFEFSPGINFWGLDFPEEAQS